MFINVHERTGDQPGRVLRRESIWGAVKYFMTTHGGSLPHALGYLRTLEHGSAIWAKPDEIGVLSHRDRMH